MKNVLNKVLSMLLVCSLVFTTNAVVTLADGLNAETTNATETTMIETTTVKKTEEDSEDETTVEEPEEDETTTEETTIEETTAEETTTEETTTAEITTEETTTEEITAEETTTEESATKETTVEETTTEESTTEEITAEETTTKETTTDETTIEETTAEETTAGETTKEETTVGEEQPTTESSEKSKTLELNNEIKATESEVIGKDNLFGEGPTWMYYWTHEDMYGVYTLHLSGNPPADNPYYGEINTTGQIEYDSIYTDVDPKRGRFNKIIIHDPIFALSCHNMFKDFSKVEKIEGLDYIDTISVTNFTSMFEGCSSLKALDLSDLDTSNAVLMSYMFKGCSNLRTILVDNSFVRPPMPELSFSMFNNCPKLHGQRGTESKEGEEYNVNYARVDGGPTNPGFFTKKGEEWMYWYRVVPYVLHLTSNKPTSGDYEIVTRYDAVEYGLYKELNKADIKKVVFDNEWAAETYAELFCGFTNLEEIEGLDKFKIDKVKSMRAMFKDCKKLEYIDLSHIQNANIENINEMFYGCSSLKKIMADDDFAVVCEGASKSENMFKDCTNLVGCNGTAYDSSHIDKEYARLDRIPNPNNKGYFSTTPWMYWWLTDSGKTMHLSGTKPTGITAKEITITSTIEYVGLQKANITKVVFDDTVLAQSCEELFANFTNLVTIEGLDKLNTILIESMKGMFRSCEKLKILDLRTFKTQIVREMAEMFENCTALHTILVDKDNFNVSNVKLSSGDKGTNMFNGCNSLYGKCGTKVDNTTNVNYAHIDDTSDPGYFTDGPWLYYYVEGNNIIHYTNTKNDNCDSITRIDTIVYNNLEKNNITKAVFDTDIDAVTYAGLFEEFTALKDIEGFDKLKFNKANSMKRMFYSCSSLEILDLRSLGSTSGIKYMKEMFTNCSMLMLIIVDSNFVTTAVTDYGSKMFQGCTKLVGGNGTSYNDNYSNDKAWACLDGGSSAKRGYFSKYPWMWWYVTDGGKTMHYTSTYMPIDGIRGVSADTEIYYAGLSLPDKSKVNRAVFDNEIVAVTCKKFFYFFGSLQYIEGLDKLNTSNVIDMTSMFEYCSALTSLDLTGLNTSKAKNMYLMFSDCSSLRDLNLSTLNTGNVENMRAMFHGCISLTYMDLSGSGFNTSNVTNMSQMFYGCDNLATIVAGNNFDTSKVTEDYQMFYNSWNLVGSNGTKNDGSHVGKEYACLDSETQPGFFSTAPWMWWYIETSGKTIHLTSTKPANGGMGVTRVDQISYVGLNDEGKSKITKAVFDDDIDPMTCVSIFSNFNELVSIENITKLHTNTITNMKEMFYNCKKLKNINLTGLLTDSVKDMTSMFEGCSSLEGLDISYFETTNVVSMNSMFRDCSSLKFLDIRLFNTANVKDMSYMFKGCESLESLDLTSFSTANVTNMSYMFNNCSSLKNIYSATFDVGNVSDDESMFEGCTSLKGSNGTVYDATHVGKEYAHLDGGTASPGYFYTNDWMWWHVDGTTLHLYGYEPDSYEGVISGADNIVYDSSLNRDTITKVVIDNEIKARTGNRMFFTFTNLAEIEGLTNLNTSEVMNMNMMFYGCENLTTLDLSKFDTSKVTEMSSMFDNCSRVANLDVTGFDTSMVTNMSSMFSQCSELHSLDLTKFNTKNVINMSGFLARCVNITSLDLSKIDTSNVIDMSNMFDGCSALVTIFASNKFVTSQVIESENMFLGCTSILGSDGTDYDPNHIDKEYARPDDDRAGVRGYFSRGNWMWWYLDSTGKTLHLTNSEPASGGTGINSGVNIEYVGLTKSDITKVVFDDYIIADTCEMLFKDFNNLVEIEGLNQLGLEFAHSMDEMFLNCKKLKSIDMSNFFTSNMTNMSEIFSGCESLTELDFSKAGNFNTANSKGMLEMFKNCNKLTVLDLSIFDTKNVEWMQGMFSGCLALKRIIVSEAFSTVMVGDGGTDMFKGCKELVGSYGTTYSESHVDLAYARIDEGPDSLNPGYFTLSGAPVGVKSISINTNPNETTYQEGQTLNPTGLKINLEYFDGTKGVVEYTSETEMSFTFTPSLSDILTLSDNSVTVAYYDKTTSFAITVKKKDSGGGEDSGGSGGSSGGGGGGETGGPLILDEVPNVTNISVTSAVLGVLINSNSTWIYDPINNGWKLSGTNENGNTIYATNGFYVLSQMRTQIINGVETQTQINSTYCFNEKGNMLTGWILTSDNKWYFFENKKVADEGKMVTGWKQIQNAWYFFGEDGVMYVNTITPDGYRVGADGKLIS